MDKIVVGVDDSAGGRAALGWALQEAAIRGAELHVVNAWTLPSSEGWNAEWPIDAAWFQERSEQLLQRMIDEVEAPDDPVEPVIVSLMCEGPAFGLLNYAKGADLLVVGSRGRGGFKGLVLGSVSTHCVHHGPCPVVVVRDSY